ncbi:hypothetical protein E5626_23310 [Salmonella enterica]|nr:hypothetical protein [Salmonella enterica]EAV5211702.1 hypothetical protein [Salmonella enterica]EAY8202858.1 hypothetical protein [Salmonella enterica]EBP6803578.1 hypothetical protein [Salmonella enterica]ECE0863129.1 hypothetical protein [Salmonella enterica]
MTRLLLEYLFSAISEIEYKEFCAAAFSLLSYLFNKIFFKSKLLVSFFSALVKFSKLSILALLISTPSSG